MSVVFRCQAELSIAKDAGMKFCDTRTCMSGYIKEKEYNPRSLSLAQRPLGPCRQLVKFNTNAKFAGLEGQVEFNLACADYYGGRV